MMADKAFKDKIPESVKQPAIRLSVKMLGKGLQLFRWVYRIGNGALRFVERQGFNVERELPPAFANLYKKSQNALELPPFGVDDFLRLTVDSENAPAESTAAIETSIIIPVYNKADYTFQCLRALFREIDTSKNEIIVVDNASRDETAPLLEQLAGRVRVVRNERNEGFVEACNKGAAAARGKYLVFLNNDTIVQPGWLQTLVETAEEDEKVGAVGSMIIYPHGHLQEAGGIVWNDATAYAYGWSENPHELHYNFAREVDYCSGASLLISKELFERLGRFDLRYAPAYYEDTDLCMSVRAAGLKVVYQPASRIVHYEGATAGTNKQTGFKRFQEINQHKFLEKWRDTLAREHFPPARENRLPASNRKKGRRIVVFFNQIPKPDEDSGSVRMTAILEALGRNDRVALVYIHKKPNDYQYEQALGRMGIECVWIVDFDKRFENEKCDAAVLCYPKVADLMFAKIRRKFPDAKIIYDTVDVHFVRLQREFGLTGDKKIARESERMKKIETRLARDADQVWCVTEDDRKYLNEAVPPARIEIIPNIHEMHGRGKSFAERRDLFFIGSFRHRPNGDAITYFLDEIFPRVLAQMPDVRFNIVGSYPPPEIFARNSENVRVAGFVADVAPFFETNRVFVAPLRYGAGMKGKIGQALAFGLPTVTTAIGAEGMNLRSGEEVLIADRAEDFADAVCRLYQNEALWQKLSDNGHRFIQENFSSPVIGRKITAVIDSTLNGRKNLQS